MTPIVVGETASRLINVSGSDVCFTYDEADGPARRLIAKAKELDWLKEEIFIIPTKSKQESLKLEKEMSKTFNLFQS